MATRLKPTPLNPLGILGIDFIEFRCGNAIALSHMLASGFGFRTVAERNPAVDSEVAYLCRILRQGDINLAITSAAVGPGAESLTNDSALRVASEIAASVHKQGDTVSDVAFRVSDVRMAFDTAVRRGARPIAEPAERRDNLGILRRARVAAGALCPANFVHTLIERGSYSGVWAPRYRVATSHPDHLAPVGVTKLGHIRVQTPPGQAELYAQSYAEQFGLSVGCAPQLISERNHGEWSARSAEAGLVMLFGAAPGTNDIRAQRTQLDAGLRRGNSAHPDLARSDERFAFVSHVGFIVEDVFAAALALSARQISAPISIPSDLDPTAYSDDPISSGLVAKLGITPRFEGSLLHLRIVTPPIGPRAESPLLELFETQQLSRRTRSRSLVSA